MSLLPCKEIEPAGAANCAIIWLHGLGADGNDFVPLVPQLQLPADARARFVFPHAPSIPVTVNGGYVMPAWYDFTSAALEREVDEQQLRTSSRAVQALVDRELERGIDSRKILLAGFSQGGAVALEAALTYPKPLAGLLVLSSYFATADSIEPQEANRSLPILVQHGSFDPVLPEVLGQRAAGRLQELGYPVQYRSYPMEHSLCPPQVADISRWLQQVLRPVRATD